MTMGLAAMSWEAVVKVVGAIGASKECLEKKGREERRGEDVSEEEERERERGKRTFL